MNTKQWYLSKTLWLNVVAGIAMLLQTQYGFIVDPETQAGLLAVINLLLRLITNSQLDWAGKTPSGGNPEAGFINLNFLLELFLVVFMIAMLAGCATTSPTAPPGKNDTPQVLAGKSLLAVKATITTAAKSTDGLCRAGQLPADKCAQAKIAYGQAKPAYDAAVDAYLLMTSTGGDPADFGRTLARAESLAANLFAISGGAK